MVFFLVFQQIGKNYLKFREKSMRMKLRKMKRGTKMRLRTIRTYWRTSISKMIQARILWRPFVLLLQNLSTQMTRHRKQKKI
jgi:hypothetical protein